MMKRVKVMGSIVLVFVLFINFMSDVALAIKPGEECFGFKLCKEYVFEGHPVLQFEHVKTGAQVVVEKSNDIQRSFEVGFKTPAENDKGANHVVEHCILAGSKTSKIDKMMWNLKKFAYGNEINGYTYPNYTAYPVSSYDEDEMNALAEFYVDAIFNPRFLHDERIFKEEGIKFELDDNGKLQVTGRAFNEINNCQRFFKKEQLSFLFPDKKDQFVSGGHPIAMMDLTFQDVCDTYNRYYHPSNSLFIITGDIDYQRIFEWLNNKYLSKYDKKDMSFISHQMGSNKPRENFMHSKMYVDSNAKKTHIARCFYMLETPMTEDIKKLNKAIKILSDSCTKAHRYLKEKGYMSFDISGIETGFTTPYVYIDLYTDDVSLLEESVLKDVLKEFSSKMFLSQQDLDVRNSKDDFYDRMRRNSRRYDAYLPCDRMLNSFVHSNNPLSSEYFIINGNKIVGPWEGSFSAEEFNSFIAKVFEKIDPMIFVSEVTDDPSYSANSQVQKKLESLEKDKEKLTEGYLEQREWSSLPLSDEGVQEIKSKLKKFSEIDIPELSQEVDKDEVLGKPCYVAQSDINDLLEISLFFDINHLSKQDLICLNLFKYLLTRVGTNNNDYESTKRARQDKISISYDKYFFIRDDRTQQSTYVLDFTTLKEKIDDAKKFFGQMINCPNFKEVDRVSSLIKKLIEMIECKPPEEVKLDEKFGKCGDESEVYFAQVETSEYLDFFKKIYKEICQTKNSDSLDKKLFDLKKIVLNRKTLFASAIISSGENVDVAKKVVEDITKLLTEYDVELKSLNIQRGSPSSFLLQNKEFHNNAVSQTLYLDESVSKHELEIVGKVVENYYMIPNVMQVLGAYIMCVSTGKNKIVYVSISNPDVKATLDIFIKCSDFISQFDISQEELYLICKNIMSDDLSFLRSKTSIAVSQVMSIIEGRQDFCSEFNERMRILKSIDIDKIRKFAKVLKESVESNNVSTIVITSDESLGLDGFEVIKTETM